jgi:hypothetical protein
MMEPAPPPGKRPEQALFTPGTRSPYPIGWIVLVFVLPLIALVFVRLLDPSADPRRGHKPADDTDESGHEPGSGGLAEDPRKDNPGRQEHQQYD